MRKEYSAPKVNTEIVKVGVFGSYAGNDTGGCSAIGFLFPFFGLCCGGGGG